MNIVIIGATGMIGSRIASEARAREHTVSGVTRSGSDGTSAADATDVARVTELLEGQDAAVLSVSAPRDGTPPAGPLLSIGRAFIEAVRNANVPRVLIVGGAGSLLLADGSRLVDSETFPDMYRPEALAHAELLDMIRNEAGDLDWTYVSPSALIAPGERTGSTRIGVDHLLVDSNGDSSVSAEDFAAAVVDELETNANVRRRITIGPPE